MTRVRLFKVLLFVVPIAAVIIGLRLIDHEVRRAGVPEGYDVVVESDRWQAWGLVEAGGFEEVVQAIDSFERAFVRTFAEPFSLSLREDQTVVYLFETREAFESFSENRDTPHAQRIQGYYRPADRTMVVYGSSREGMIKTMRHELVHALLDQEVQGENQAWSRWLNEGLASVFETGRIIDGRVRAEPPSAALRAAWDRRRATNSVPPVSEYVRNATGFDRDMQFFYAYAEILVGYLLDRERSLFDEYFQRERRPGPVDPREFTARFGEDLRPELDAWLDSFPR